MSRYLILFIGTWVMFFALLDARPYIQHRSSLTLDGTVYSGQATYYDPGLGACGIVSNGTELVCAIADALYDTRTLKGNPNDNEFCGEQISVTGPNGTVIVTVVDRCGSCKHDDLDLSRPAFNQVGDPLNGHVLITWHFI